MSHESNLLKGAWDASNRLQKVILIGMVSFATLFNFAHGWVLLAPLFAPFTVIIALLWTIFHIGSVMFIWYVVAFIFTIVIPREYAGTLIVFRQTVSAIFIGFTPHVAFVVFVNWFGGPDSTNAGPLLELLARTYESLAWKLQDRVGDYLLPSFFAGAVLSLLMFWLTRKPERRQLRSVWQRVRDAARFSGLILVSATTFTVMTSIPAGEWQPSSRIILQRRIEKEIKAVARLALYQAVVTGLQTPNNPLSYSLHRAIQALPGDTFAVGSSGSQGVQDIVDATREKSPSSNDGSQISTAFESVSRLHARTLAQEVRSETLDADRKAEQARQEMAEIIGSGVSEVSKSLIGELAGALAEDAATRLAEMLLAQDTTSTWITKSVQQKAQELLQSARSGARNILYRVQVALKAPTLANVLREKRARAEAEERARFEERLRGEGRFEPRVRPIP
jgi:hypothetical protein